MLINKPELRSRPFEVFTALHVAPLTLEAINPLHVSPEDVFAQAFKIPVTFQKFTILQGVSCVLG